MKCYFINNHRQFVVAFKRSFTFLCEDLKGKLQVCTFIMFAFTLVYTSCTWCFSLCIYVTLQIGTISGGFRGGAPGARPGRAPLRPKIFWFSCSFSENLTKSYVGAPPPPRGSVPLPTGNPGSAPAYGGFFSVIKF